MQKLVQDLECSYIRSAIHFRWFEGGVWLEYGNCDPDKPREEWLVETVNRIIDVLPRYDSFQIVFNPDFTDWTPFCRRGFEQTTCYTYVVDPKDYENEEELFDSFQKTRRKNIKKAEQLYTVDHDMTGDEFYDFLIDAYKEKAKRLSYSYEQFHRLDEAVAEHNARIIYRAKDVSGNTVAVCYMICDTGRWYHMFGTFKQAARGAKELISWSGMKDCMRQNVVYDFEGSMIQGVAEYNRGFHVKKVPYYVISNDSDKMKLIKSLKTIMGILKKRGK